MNSDVLYLNNSATSFPKPQAVADAVYDAVATIPEMTGRGEEATAKDRVLNARVKLARFLGCPIPERLIFTSNSTDAMNMAIHGLFDSLDSGCRHHVVSTTNDHNSVLRPLNTLQSQGRAAVDYVPSDPLGRYDLAAIIDSITDSTRLVAINHLSNVVGTIAPIAELGAYCRQRGIPFLVDASQSAGLLDIDVEAMNIDLLSITGHKYLLGPTGIGALYIAEHINLAPRRQGGTGIKSADPLQPLEMPIQFEAGTVNYIGLVGLDAARQELEKIGLEKIRSIIHDYRYKTETGLRDIEGVTVYGPGADEEKGAVISFKIDNMDVAQTDQLLRSHYRIITRSGLHCAPLCHQRLGTAPAGTVRISFSHLTPENAPERLLQAVQEIVSELN
jgi:cysteine desulfurase/selenocysteine lyase